MKKMTLLLVLILLWTFVVPVSAGIEPSPFIVGKLDAISNSLSVVNQRINDAFDRMGVGPSPFVPIANQLGAIDNQLNHLNARIASLVAEVDEQGISMDPAVVTAMSLVLQSARSLSSNLQVKTVEWQGILPDDAQSILLQAATNARLITDLFEPYNPGLAAPTGLRVVDDTMSIMLELNWDAVGEATGYDVQRSLASTGPWEDADVLMNDNKAFDQPDPWGQYYFYRVRASRQYGESQWYSAWTDPVGGTLNSAEVPSNFSASSTSTSITVNWNPTYMASGYQVNIILTDVVHRYTQTPLTTWTAEGLQPDTEYYVEVFYFRTAPVGANGSTTFGTHTPPLYIRTKPE